MAHLCFLSCFSHAFASVHFCLVVTCWERADLLALVGDVSCIFVTFPCGILGQMWHLIVSFPDLCLLSYLDCAPNQARISLHCSHIEISCNGMFCSIQFQMAQYVLPGNVFTRNVKIIVCKMG